MDARPYVPSPRTTLIASSVVVACAWLVLDFVLRDPWTILYIFIALGSDFLVRNMTTGLFAQIYWPVVTAVQVFFCVTFFVGPGLVVLWLGRGRLSPTLTSSLIFAWLLFYLAALAFLFEPGLLRRGA